MTDSALLYNVHCMSARLPVMLSAKKNNGAKNELRVTKTCLFKGFNVFRPKEALD